MRNSKSRIEHNPLIVRTIEAIHPAPKSESHTWYWRVQASFYFFE